VTNELEWLISVDDHVIEPKGLWQDRVPKADRDRAPRVVEEDGVSYWLYEDLKMPINGELAAAGRKREDVSPLPISYDVMRPGYYDPAARVLDMNQDGILSAMCFPMFPRFCGQTFNEAKDKDFALVCVQAYNDWMIDEWSAYAPGRFIPLIIVPLWDPTLAAREVERCRDKGAKAIAFSENPSKLGLPSIHSRDGHWDPLFSAANDTGMPICTHVGSSSDMPITSPDAPLIVMSVLTPQNLSRCMVDWIFSGNFFKFPDLKLCLSEGGIGWIPHILERCDHDAARITWAKDGDYRWDFEKNTAAVWDETGARSLEGRTPTDLFRKHIYGCFIEDYFGAQNLELIGTDNVMMESDYPHGDTSFPHTIDRAQKQLAGQTDETKWKVMQGNAQRVFDFRAVDPATITSPTDLGTVPTGPSGR
jgi:predicted TIM-barrel fold metal-dependent hydrolase